MGCLLRSEVNLLIDVPHFPHRPPPPALHPENGNSRPNYIYWTQLSMRSSQSEESINELANKVTNSKYQKCKTLYTLIQFFFRSWTGQRASKRNWRLNDVREFLILGGDLATNCIQSQVHYPRTLFQGKVQHSSILNTCLVPAPLIMPALAYLGSFIHMLAPLQTHAPHLYSHTEFILSKLYRWKNKVMY